MQTLYSWYKIQTMYKGLLHSHTFFVLVFLIHYIVKLVLLLTNKKEPLAKYTKATRIPEMIFSFGFLASGLGMLISSAVFSKFLIIKLICVFTSIPLAIIGFKKSNKALAFIAVFLLVMSYGLAEMHKKSMAGKTTAASGQSIYTETCFKCHGADGKLGVNGAKDLSITLLSAEEQRVIIINGKGAMSGYKDLTAAQLDSVVQYIATLKQ